MTTYRLVRVCPDGATRQQNKLRSRRDAARCAFYVLTDNLATRDQKIASEIAAQLEDAQTGTEVGAFGYVFRIEVE